MSIGDRNGILNIIENIQYNEKKLKELDIIEGINVRDNQLLVVLRVPSVDCKILDIKKCIENSLSGKFKEIKFIETSKRSASEKSQKYTFNNVKQVVLVSSGKGGVGKSTIAYGLARTLSEKHNVGLLDADIYGPSIPILAGVHEEPRFNNSEFEPIIKDGIKLNSIGFLIPADKSLVWRGPMITKAIHKLFLNTNWGELDYLIIDMPPGTGDIHLTILEKYHVDKVVMVTTPSKLAEADVSRARDMYKKLGIKEIIDICNMAYMESGGERFYPFGKSSSANQFPLSKDISDDVHLKRFANDLQKNK
ncbi:MAG: P-loop NTPase [Rickettsiales bacterium]